MDIQAERSLLIERLKLIQDATVLQAIKNLLDRGPSPAEGRVSIEQYNRELEEADREIDEGHFISQEDLEKESKSW